MPDTTVIYYTSNREKESFERKICQALLETKGDLPLISVSQKPMDLGQNICVGDVGAKKQHVYRQLLIGAEAATTRFVCTAESDFLYGPEYFEFVPDRDDTFYLARPCWVLRVQRGKRRAAFRKPANVDAPLVVERKTLIKRIQAMFANLTDYWSEAWENTRYNIYMLNPRHVKIRSFNAGAGSVTFKTDENMHRGTPWIERTRTEDIPGWGNVFDLQDKYYTCHT